MTVIQPIFDTTTTKQLILEGCFDVVRSLGIYSLLWSVLQTTFVQMFGSGGIFLFLGFMPLLSEFGLYRVGYSKWNRKRGSLSRDGWQYDIFDNFLWKPYTCSFRICNCCFASLLVMDLEHFFQIVDFL